MRAGAHRKNRGGCLVFAAGALCAAGWAAADQQQNVTVSGTAAQLTAAGFGADNGSNITVGLAETGDPNAAGTKTANSNLPNGNPNLPAANVVVLSSTPNIRNHASETSGVIISTIPGQAGIATSAVIASGNLGDLVANGAVAAGANTNEGSANMLALFQRPGLPVVNMSFGISRTNDPTFANNGLTALSPFVDWAIQKYEVVGVVAGNEGSAGSPSDAFNVINVAASGVRVGNTINYNVVDFQNYNTSNVTADGRIKTDIVAPGGDPGPAGAFVPNQVGSFNALPAFANLFQTTAGGQYNYIGQVGGNAAYTNDTFNGNSTANSGIAVDSAAPNVPAGPPATNPGNLQGADTVELNATIDPPPAGGTMTSNATLAGTSFAAPLVSGATALLYQQFKIQSNSNAAYLNPLAAEALILNGATKVGLTSTNAGGASNPWTRAAATGAKRDVATPSGVDSPNVQPGLDPLLGTGQLNVVNSLKNELAGRQMPGVVNPVGWDFQTVPVDTRNGGKFIPQDIIPADNPSSTDPTKYAFGYDINQVSGLFTATLDWYMPVTTNGAGGVWAPGGGATPSSSLTDGTLSDLDLYLYQITAGPTYTLVSSSTSALDNVEHVYVPNLPLGNYELDVVDVNNPQATQYGLAWAVPEPAALGVVVPLVGLVCGRRRRGG